MKDPAADKPVPSILRLRSSVPPITPSPHHPITLVIALVLFLTLPSSTPADRLPSPPATPTSSAVSVDPLLAAAWEAERCPGHPSSATCLLLALAISCASDDAPASCRADRDQDRCLDVAEVRVRLNPHDGGDCLSDSHGQPLVNCLVRWVDLPCAPTRLPASAPLRGGDCAPYARDPLCDGFAPGRS